MIRTKEAAWAYRAKLDGLISTAADEAALTAVEVFPAWRPDGRLCCGRPCALRWQAVSLRAGAHFAVRLVANRNTQPVGVGG